MKEFFQATNFQGKSLELIVKIESIMSEYIRQGYRLTVRQLYYQLVARDIIPNTERSYKNTVNLVANARLAGLLDWDAIEDRTRGFISRPSWDSGQEILDSCAHQFHMDMWATQSHRVFVIVEKEALAGVLERVCHEYDVPLLAARGYPSISTLREFAKRDIRGQDQEILILHLGDHDPSGIDMTRDLEDRLAMLGHNAPFELRRIALTMDQIDDQKPPPNPAKQTDSRFEGYAELYGDESWELDALQPKYLHDLVAEHINAVIDDDAWADREAEIDHVKERISVIASKFNEED